MRYTTGEVAALIAPLLGQDPENVAQFTVVGRTKGGETVYLESSETAGTGRNDARAAYSLMAAAMDILRPHARSGGTS